MSYSTLRATGRVVSFQTKSVPVLPLNYTNVTIQGIVGFQIALSIEDVSAKYQQVAAYNNLGETPPEKAEYVVVRHASGETEVLALNWIEENSIRSTSAVNKRVDLIGVESTINDKLSKALRNIGITNFTITDV